MDNVRRDEAIARVRPRPGTQVEFVVDPATTRSIDDELALYADDETLEFHTTRTVVRLYEYDLDFVSRSEAKRLTRNLDRFREVIVDFYGIEGIGQGFADEVFRVWQSRHPEVRLVPVDMNDAVRLLVGGAQRRYQEAKGTSPR